VAARRDSNPRRIDREAAWMPVRMFHDICTGWPSAVRVAWLLSSLARVVAIARRGRAGRAAGVPAPPGVVARRGARRPILAGDGQAVRLLGAGGHGGSTAAPARAPGPTLTSVCTTAAGRPMRRPHEPPMEPTPWRWAWVMVFEKAKYPQAFCDCATAGQLRRRGEHYRPLFDAGQWPTPDDLARWNVDAETARKSLASSLAHSLGIATAAALAGVAVGVLRGSLGLDLPMDCGKALQAVGGWLAAVGTIFALGQAPQTFKRQSLPELVQPKIFLAFTVPGLALAIAGTVW
jgi:hypothetical protein